MTVKQWSAWLLAAGTATALSIVTALNNSVPEPVNEPVITLAAMNQAQKDSVIRTEILRASPGDEVISMRKKHVKTYKETGGRFSSKIFLKQKHYFDESDSMYKDIDLSIHNVADDVKDNPDRQFDNYVDAGCYRTTWFKEKPWDYTIRKNDYFVTYTALFDTSGIHIITDYSEEGVKQSIVLQDSTSGASFNWLIETNTVMTFDNSETVFKDNSGVFLFRIPQAVAWSGDYSPIDVVSSSHGDTLTYDLIIPSDTVYPVTLDPVTLLSQSGATYALESNDGSTYGGARDVTDYDTTQSVRIGQINNGTYYVYRAHLHFDTSSLPDWADYDSIKVAVGTITSDSDDTSFDIHLVESTTSGTSASSDWFNDFPGWAASGSYSVTDLITPVSSSGYSVSDTVKVTLNATGLTKISNTDSTRFFVMSSRDIENNAPSGNEYFFFGNDGYIQVWYRPPINKPTNFRLDNPTTSSIRVQYTRNHSESVDSVAVQNAADNSHVKYFDTVTDTLTTVTGLSENTLCSWLAMVDSAGFQVYSDPDSLYTLISSPGINDVNIVPISSDTLRITATQPPNGTSGSTGIQVEAVSGSGATSSGWLDGQFSYLDGGVNPDSTYVYKVRYRNGDGTVTDYSPDIMYDMNGVETLVVNLSGDTFDDYNVDFGDGRRDSTVVRVGTSDSGERLDGFISFSLPWQVVNGGIDSLFLTMNRTTEENLRTPVLTVYGIASKFDNAIESRNLGAQDSTSVTAVWTVSSGTGSKTSPDLRAIFNEWRDIAGLKDFSYDFGFRIDDSSQADSVRAVFLDSSHPSYSNDTRLTFYYTPGIIDSLEGAPGSFAMTVLTADSIRVSWTDNSDSEYGFVLLNFADSSLVNGTDSLAQNTTCLDVGGLTPNTLYEWFVRAYTAGDDSSSSSSSARTHARIPGLTTVSSLSSNTISFILVTEDNPGTTQFAVQDSISGLYIDGSAEPETLRAGPAGNWSWRTYNQWGGAQGDTLTGLSPDSLYVIRAKAQTDD
ncbi:fibronectin type III domain-containing protein [Candidatus Latescibacterota bacterium]